MKIEVRSVLVSEDVSSVVDDQMSALYAYIEDIPSPEKLTEIDVEVVLRRLRGAVREIEMVYPKGRRRVAENIGW